MSIAYLRDYIKECKATGTEATWEGLNEYKKRALCRGHK